MLCTCRNDGQQEDKPSGVDSSVDFEAMSKWQSGILADCTILEKYTLANENQIPKELDISLLITTL